jgi:hypothetical protein
VLAGCRCTRETLAQASFRPREVANLTNACVFPLAGSGLPSGSTHKIGPSCSILWVPL